MSRFSCMLFLSVRGFLKLRRTGQPAMYNATAVLPSSSSEMSRHPVLPAFQKLNKPRPPLPPAPCSFKNTS